MRRRLPSTMSVLGALGLVAMLATACGGSSSNGVASGSITCGNLTGAATFSPALTLIGSMPETTNISLQATDCTTKGSNVAHVTSGTAVTVEKLSTNGCTSLLSSTMALKLTVQWKPASVKASLVTFSAYMAAEGAAGSAGFDFPGPGGKVKVSGSFAGTDAGASSKATVLTTEPVKQLIAACSSAAGLASIPITSGSATLG